MKSTLNGIWQKAHTLYEGRPFLATFANAAGWSVLGSFVSRIFTFLTMVFVVRILGKSAFGQLGLIQSTVFMLGPLAGAGLGQMANKFLAELKDINPQRATRVMTLVNQAGWIMGGLMALTLFFTAPFLCNSTLNAPLLVMPLKWSAITLLFTVLSGVQVGILAGLGQFKKVAFINLASGIISLPLILAGTWQSGVLGAVVGTSTGLFLTYALGVVVLRNGIHESQLGFYLKPTVDERKLLFSFFVPLVMSSLLIAPVIWMSNSLLARQPNGFAELGIVNAALQMQNVLLFVPNALGSVFLSSLAELKGAGNIGAFERRLRFCLLLVFGISVIQFCILYVLAPLILAAFGKEFRGDSIVFLLVTGSAIFIAISNVFSRALISKGNVWADLQLNFVWGATTLLFSFLLVARYLSVGLGISFCLASAMQLMAQYLYLRKTRDYERLE